MENPGRKIGFSTFALLCPKWCIPVGAAGTYNFCVCTYHKNIKLMLVVMNSSSNYRHIMKLCVCNVDRYDCMMGHCNNCLDLSVLKSFLRKKLLKIIDPDEIKEESKFDDFIENLVGKFGELMKHHYVAKKQAEFFKQLKENLQFGECYYSRFCRSLFLLSPGCCPRIPLE